MQESRAWGERKNDLGEAFVGGYSYFTWRKAS
jgi:hypothetical protein